MHAPPTTRDRAPFPTPILSAPATMAGAPLTGPPPGPAGPNLTDLGSNRGCPRENISREVCAPAMPCDAPPLTSTAKPGSLDHLPPLEITPTEASREGSKTC
ncbi:hypothetical protein F511_36605 [Dorcoceras hygrometricum]|uniref:Uncharacterized protein n=1 Tax=Dorcoceras hygrometricum TaxID=472368 RepID=A0A2Z7AVQ2_9LAMI|nr:hypothetical protein F511_36605 [Dorcoceras hygrometricum]